MLRRLSIAILFLLPHAGYAQLSSRIYSMRDGLPQSDISGIAEDTLGYLWVGMFAGGIARFDGKTFTQFGPAQGLENIEVTDIATDKNGTLWFGTTRSVGTYDGKRFFDRVKYATARPRLVFPKGDSVLSQATHNGQWRYIHKEDTGALTAHHPLSGIVLGRHFTAIDFGGYNPRTNKMILCNGSNYRTVEVGNSFQALYHIVKTPHGFLLSTNTGLFRIPADRDTIINVSRTDDVIYFADSMRRSACLQGPDNSIFHSNSAGVKNKIITAGVNRTFADREGNFWLGTRGKGLIKIFPVVFEKIELGSGDEKIAVRSVYRDSRKRLWIGTISNGLYQVTNNKVASHFQLAGLNYVPAIIETSGQKLVFAGNGGLFEFRNGNIIPIQTGIRGAFSMSEGANELLVGTVGTNMYAVTNNEVREIRSSYPRVRHITYDGNKKRYLLATDDGLIYFSHDKFQHAGITDRTVNVARHSRDSVLFLGTAGYGLIASSPGVRRVFTKADGLCDDYIYSIAISGHTMWIGTNNGINKIEFTSDWNIRDLVHYGLESGLDELETNLNAIHLSDSTLTIGTVSGVFEHRIHQPVDPWPENKVHFTEFQFTNEEHESFNLDRTESTVPAGHNRFEFSVNQVVKRAGQLEIKYSVRLLGYDSMWSAPGQQKDFDFRSLPPGEYTAEVRSHHASKVNTVLSRAFHIEPFFHQTNLFRVGAMLTGLTGLILLLQWSLKKRYRKALLVEQIRHSEEKRLREEIAADFHDELGNELARLTSSLSILKIKKLLNQETYDQLNYSLQRIVTGTRDFIWSLNLDNNDLGNTIIHLKDFGERLFNEKQIDFSFLGSIPVDIKLQPGQSRQVNFIFKEAMTNAFRHSGASRVQFGIDQLDDGVRIFVKDNGTGLQRRTGRAGGIENIRVRAKKIGAELILSSDSGTTVTLLIKCNRPRQEKQ